jgi:hypothetical protein
MSDCDGTFSFLHGKSTAASEPCPNHHSALRITHHVAAEPQPHDQTVMKHNLTLILRLLEGGLYSLSLPNRQKLRNHRKRYRQLLTTHPSDIRAYVSQRAMAQFSRPFNNRIAHRAKPTQPYVSTPSSHKTCIMPGNEIFSPSYLSQEGQ